MKEIRTLIPLSFPYPHSKVDRSLKKIHLSQESKLKSSSKKASRVDRVGPGIKVHPGIRVVMMLNTVTRLSDTCTEKYLWIVKRLVLTDTAHKSLAWMDQGPDVPVMWKEM